MKPFKDTVSVFDDVAAFATVNHNSVRYMLHSIEET